MGLLPFFWLGDGPSAVQAGLPLSGGLKGKDEKRLMSVTCTSFPPEQAGTGLNSVLDGLCSLFLLALSIAGVLYVERLKD